ncbi:MAG: Lrp/AsnC family transcriptional regulator [Novosphingobium sp.]|nr:Lrp/AsnC family transcriptional regulator [Novosphingobium sp.]
MPENLDQFDLAILDHLQEDGRMTNQELADAIGLSPSPCLRRTRRLEERGVIDGYVALVDPAKMGLGVTAFLRIRLSSQDDASLALFEESIASFPEVMECYLMTGEADYQLRVLVPSLGAYEDFLRHRLTKVQGVAQVTTSFALRPVTYRTKLPHAEG